MKKNNIVYYIAVFGVFFINLVDVSKVINIDGDIRDIVYLALSIMFLIKIGMSRYLKKEIIPICILGVINLYTFYILRNYMFLINFLAMISIKDMDIKKIVKIDIGVKLFFLTINTLTYLYDYNFNYSKVESTFVYTAKYGIRQALYFSHPNTAAGIAVWCAIDILFVYGKNLKAILCAFFIVILYGYLTISRTAILIFVLFLLILFLAQKEKLQSKMEFITKWSFEIFMIFTIVLTIIPEVINNQAFVNTLDKLLSRRISYANSAYEIYGFNLLANERANSLKEGLIVDNFYVRSMISYGVIVVIALMVMYKKIKGKISNSELTILLIFPIYLFNELFCYNIGRALALLVLANIIFNQRSREKDGID